MVGKYAKVSHITGVIVLTMQKIAVITGATSGIGLACAKLLISKGYKVYGIARRPYSGTDFECFSADVCDYAAIDRILKEIYTREGHIDVLVNNAGMGIAGAIEEASPESIDKIVGVNLTALCVLCSKTVPYMRGNCAKGGSHVNPEGAKIINISSVGGIMPLPYQAMYSATKAGVEVFSRAIANELKPYNIKVCAVLPNDTKTGFTEARLCEGTNSRAIKSVEKMARDERRGKSPQLVARVVYKVARHKNPPLRVSVGGISKLEVFLSRLLPVRLINYIIYKMYCK